GYTFARLEAALYKCICRLDPAHNLDNDLYIIVLNDRLEIMDDLFLYRISREILQIQYILNIQFISDPLIDPGPICIYYFYHSGTYRSITHNRYIDHKFLPLAICRFLQIRIDKRINISIQHSRHIAALHIGPVILHKSV